jgi:hypothetical protein
MKQPTPPVGGVFRPDGLLLVIVEHGATYQRVIPWKDLYKMARRGQKQTPVGAMKTFTKKVNEVIKSNEKAGMDSAKRLEEMKKITCTRFPMSAL